MRNLTVFLTVLGIVITVDIYSYFGLRYLTENLSLPTRRILLWAHIGISAFLIVNFIFFFTGHAEKWSRFYRSMVMGAAMISLFSKMIFVVFLMLDDILRGLRWIIAKVSSWFSSPAPEMQEVAESASSGQTISRQGFLVKTGVALAAIPAVGMTWGILSGAHDYRIRRKTIVLPHLPKAFDGLRLVQLSDIHSGSFYNKTAVRGGVEMALAEKPDLIFFTGDLVNNKANEMSDYISVFDKIKAPLGVYSTLGNHDYGDYTQWPSEQSKAQNLKDLIGIHKQMGWDLLMNEHHMLERQGEKLAILGVENWSNRGRFPKYGKLDQAHRGTEEASVKLLLSHDPSHWEAEVLTNYKDIDIMFAGHTHGAQFGIDTEVFKWSPVQYMYKQWAGLYEAEQKYLYVNRGFGFIGYPGRMGILPEITVIELKSKA